MVNRRNFLFGTVSAAAGGLLLRAPAEAVELFKPTLAETIAVARMPENAQYPELGETLYDVRGVPVAIVTSITVHHHQEPFHCLGDDVVRFAPGSHATIDLGVQALPAFGARFGVKR